MLEMEVDEFMRAATVQPMICVAGVQQAVLLASSPMVIRLSISAKAKITSGAHREIILICVVLHNHAVVQDV